MDLLHEEPTKERQYIKRLMKYKRITPILRNEKQGMSDINNEEIPQRDF